ncbi:MAG: alpha-E domain-containing protein [Nitrososphaerales archaeon]
MKDPRSLSSGRDKRLTDSRAYNLIWMGRWLERAENMARTLDASALAATQTGLKRKAFSATLKTVGAAWGVNAEGQANAIPALIKDDPASSIYRSLARARDNANQVGPLELIRAINASLGELEQLKALPEKPEEVHRLMTSVLTGLQGVYKVIEDRWFHREALSEEEIYRQFVNQ